MIPATYPSILDSSNRTKMLVYQVPSIVGLTRWIDYIPVKSPASESDLTLANTFANEGFILTSKVNDITGLVPFKDYVPIYLDSTATKAWSADNDGYIPMAELAGLLLDFTTGSLDSRINFSRTTNATVTNSAGQITYAPHNLLTYSEQFDNAAWTKTNSTISANVTTAPDGTITADKLVENTTAGSHSVNVTATSLNATEYTYTIYAKAGERNWLLLWLNTAGAYFDVQNGVIGTISSGVNASITLVENGWYRCSVTRTVTAGNNPCFVYMANANNSFSYTGNGTSGIYIWGAQLEVGASPTTYNSTTVKNLLGYSELFDNAAWTKSNSFVQTNLLFPSEDFGNAGWLKAGTTTVTTDTTLAPNGYQTADTLTGATDIVWSAGNSLNRQVIGLSSSTTYTFSVYIKAIAGTTAKISIRDQSTGGTTDSAAITLTSDWQRVSISRTTGAATTALGLIIGATNGTVAIWGAQLVQGSAAGDYRRTDAAALPVYYPNHNGVVCAEKLVEDTAASSLHRMFATVTTVTGTIYTQSIYAKAGERRYFSIRPESNANAAVFDLQLGTVTNTSVGVTASITPVGNGWYRCSATKVAAGTAWTSLFNLQLDGSGGGNTYTGDGTSGIYIFGAQLSDSASLDPYVLNAAAAPTAAAYYGARFDYDPVTLAPKGLLIEEQRTNILGQSEAFNTASWTMTGGTIVPNQIVAPNGTLSGTKLVANSTLSTKYVNQAVTTLASTVYSWSAYLKAGEYTTAIIYFISVSSPFENCSATINLANGTITASSAGAGATLTGTSITPAGNGWYRCTLIGSISTKTNMAVRVYPNTTTAFTGDDVSGIYIWGAQLEAGAFATSYIPTAASQVTRAADVATIQGSNFYSWINANEGSMVTNFDWLGASSFDTMFAIGTDANNYTFLGLNSSNVQRMVNIYVGTTDMNSIVAPAGGITANTYYKLAGSYKINEYAVVSNNGTVLTDTSAIPPIYNQARIGQNVDGTNGLNGHIKQISYYPQRLSNDVLKGLTA